MSTPPRNPPRFLPTLTEVVHPEDLTAAKLTPVFGPEVPALKAKQIGEGTDNLLSPEVSTLVRSIVAEQMQALRVNLRKELHTMVIQAVQEAMNSKPPSH